MGTNSAALECQKLAEKWKQPLLAFLNSLSDADDARNFSPHPFTVDALDQIIRNVRNDLYYVLSEGDNVLGYGLLRGWDDGFEIPSLGIAIHPRIRGSGLGKVFMHFLGAAAKRKGAKKVRLRVNRENTRARRLYENMGYKFEPQEQEYLVGFLELDQTSREPS
jgi:[ribosomal protein S18]-alanine N-acetyltransferase